MRKDEQKMSILSLFMVLRKSYNIRIRANDANNTNQTPQKAFV